MLILQTLYLGLPAIIANMTPILVAKLPVLRNWNSSMDFGKTYRGKRILGDHKTWRGFIFGILAAILTIAVQAWIGRNTNLYSLQVLDYSRSDILLFGAALGFGALAGDAIKSFFKRQFDVPSGASWFPWDQMDSTAGALVCLLPFYFPGWPIFFTAILVGPILHLISNPIGYVLGIKKVWW